MDNATEQKLDDAIVLEIEIAAAPERVFQALTQTEELAVWWTEGGTNHWEFEARLGGKWRATGKDETCGNWEINGEIVELNPPWSLAYTWDESVQYRPSVKQTIVRYDLERSANGTRVRLTHSGFAASQAALNEYRSGWPNVIGLLQTYFEAPAAYTSFQLPEPKPTSNSVVTK